MRRVTTKLVNMYAKCCVVYAAMPQKSMLIQRSSKHILSSPTVKANSTVNIIAEYHGLSTGTGKNTAAASVTAM